MQRTYLDYSLITLLKSDIKDRCITHFVKHSYKKKLYTHINLKSEDILHYILIYQSFGQIMHHVISKNILILPFTLHKQTNVTTRLKSLQN